MPYNVCTQEQIRYTCGHQCDGRFVKCPKHIPTEDIRCCDKSIDFRETETSPYKCKACLRPSS